MSDRLEQWAPMIARAAAKFQIPAELVRAVMAVENAAGDPNAATREKDGEFSRGLMQVKHSTALALGLNDPTRLFDPWTGIYYGALYLAKQFVRYNGDAAAAAAAYNAGSVKRTSSGAFVNQSYVNKVLARLREASGQAVGVAGALVPFALALVLALAIARRHRRAA